MRGILQHVKPLEPADLVRDPGPGGSEPDPGARSGGGVELVNVGVVEQADLDRGAGFCVSGRGRGVGLRIRIVGGGVVVEPAGHGGVEMPGVAHDVI